MKRFVWLALVWLAACTGDVATEVIQVSADPGVRQASQALKVRVWSDPYGRDQLLHEIGSVPWNERGGYTIGLSPRSGDDGQFRIEVTALKDGAPFGYARAITRYTAGERRIVSLLIEDSCSTNPVCSLQETCRAGSCANALVETNPASPSDASTVAPPDMTPIRSEDRAPRHR